MHKGNSIRILLPIKINENNFVDAFKQILFYVYNKFDKFIATNFPNKCIMLRNVNNFTRSHMLIPFPKSIKFVGTR